MAKRVRKRTKAEFASPRFRKRSGNKTSALTQSHHACDKLSNRRRQYILDIADYRWIHRFDGRDDDSAFRREPRKWDKLRTAFLKEATKPLELHWFSCNWNCDRGVSPLLKVVKNASCDAGTALRLYWLNDPYYYQEYRTIGECPYDEEREMLRILRTIECRFKSGDFSTKRIPFDPAPWISDDYSESAVHEIPAIMREPILPRSRRRR